MISRFSIPMKVRSEANERGHWRTKAKRVREQKHSVRLMLDSIGRDIARDTITDVRFVRLGKRLLDDDNLAGGFKAIRDAVGEWTGRGDAPDCGNSWSYAQELSKTYEIRIEVTHA